MTVGHVRQELGHSQAINRVTTLGLPGSQKTKIKRGRGNVGHYNAGCTWIRGTVQEVKLTEVAGSDRCPGQVLL